MSLIGHNARLEFPMPILANNERGILMKAPIIALALAMLASPALACTPEEAQAKATEISTKMQELAIKDPQKAAQVGQKLSEAQAQSVTDVESACKLYDEMLAEFE